MVLLVCCLKFLRDNSRYVSTVLPGYYVMVVSNYGLCLGCRSRGFDVCSLGAVESRDSPVTGGQFVVRTNGPSTVLLGRLHCGIVQLWSVPWALVSSSVILVLPEWP